MTEKPKPAESKPAGIVISGGNVHIGALAQGSGAHAEQVVLGTGDSAGSVREEIAELIDDLLDVIREHADELTDEASAREAAAEAAAEVATDRPDIPRVRRLLAKLGAAAGPVSEIAAAIITIERAISGKL